MATLESHDANILDAETVNWQVIVFPILLVLIIVLGGFGYYYYQQDQRDQLEAKAREALLQAKTPEEFLKIADQYPGTDQSTLALLNAAQASLVKFSYDDAAKDYQRVISAATTPAVLRDSAQVGLAFSLDASGKTDDAIKAYLVVANLGDKTPYAPYAYSTVADIYEKRGDKDNQRKTLTELASLNQESAFVRQAQSKLKELNAAPAPAIAPAPAAQVTPVAPAVKP